MKYVFIRLGGVLAIAVALLLFLPFSPGYILKKSTVIDGKDVHEWLAIVKTKDLEDKRLAIQAIGKMGPDGEPAMQELANLMLNSPEVGIRRESTQALQKLFPASVKHLNDFGKAMGDQDYIVRMHAILGIIKLKQQAYPLLPHLITAVNLPTNKERADGFTSTLRETILVAIGVASEGKDDGVPVLLEIFNQPETDTVRNAAMRGLAYVGPNAKEASAGFKKILKDPKSPNELRQEAFDSLERIGTPVPKSELVFAPLGPAIPPPGAKGPGMGKGGMNKGGAGKGGMGKEGAGKGGTEKGGDGKSNPEKGGDGKAKQEGPAPAKEGDAKKNAEADKAAEKADKLPEKANSKKD